MKKSECFILNEAEINELLDRTFTSSRAYAALEKEQLGISGFAALIKHDKNDNLFYEKLAVKAREATRARFGLVKGLYIPLYLSSACHNSCSYCGFSIENKTKRVTLSMDEIKKELKAIRAKGFSNILLVSGELKNFSNIDYLAEAVASARSAGFHSIAVELGALDEQPALMLAKAGANSFVLYQETYHRETYEKAHAGGLKAGYRLRLGGADRAIKARFKQVTLGFLVGLYSDPMFEALALYSHLSYLKQKYWDVEFSVSFPRMTSAAGVGSAFKKVDDRQYAQMLMAFRLAFPENGINLSTRETPKFRDGMANICATHLSVESKTHPGGYIDKSGEALAQFDIHDNRSLLEMTAALKGIGYDVYFKDWEMELNRL